jgi:D-alanyl-D-alanine carboxypeptidase (penicillin-binding protein 5/6)
VQVGLRAALALATALAAAWSAAPAAAAAPGHAAAKPPRLAARAWFLEDETTGEPLVAHSASRELAIASTTKLMTAHLALKRLPLGRLIAAPPYNALPAESIIGLRAGERMSVRDLLYALVLASANDAAETLAIGVAGSVRRFVREMNRSALALGLVHTHYSNPIGLDDVGNYSSARDLVTLARDLLRNRTFRHVADARKRVLHTGDHPRRIITRNTLLLEDPTATGVKTGHTVDAGWVLVASAQRKGVSLISAVLGAPSEAARDAENESLLDYGFSLYRVRRPVRAGEILARPGLRYRDDELPLVAARTLRVGVRRGQTVRRLVDAPRSVNGPVRRGQRIGRVTVRVDGRRVAAVSLVAAQAASAASVIDKARDRILNPLLLLFAGGFVILIGVALARRGRLPRPAFSGPRSRSAEERHRSREERMRRRRKEKSR